MKSYITPRLCFRFCKIAGFCLLFAYWVKSGETTGFFLLLFLVVMSLLRWRIPKLRLSILADFIICGTLAAFGELEGLLLVFPLFEAMFLGYFWTSFCVFYAVYALTPPEIGIFALSALAGFFLHSWEHERRDKLLLRDIEARRYYELEALQSDLVAALAQIEQMTAVHERTRIARDIHDNAGHEIVAAFMSFQTVRELLPTDNAEILELFDAALARLNSGTDKIREAVHNLSAVNLLGVQRLFEKCSSFSVCEIDFKVYGDTTQVPIYVWSMLESCLSEALTNIVRHAAATWVTVELDATPHIVRLRVVNDGVQKSTKPPGMGLRNLRYRASAIGGSVSVDAGEEFSVVCVIPIRRSEGKNEATDS